MPNNQNYDFSEQLCMRIAPVMVNQDKRFILFDTNTGEPLFFPQLYEATLAGLHEAGTVKSKLDSLNYLASACIALEIDLNELIARGGAPDPRQIRQIANWFKTRGGSAIKELDTEVFNRHLYYSSHYFEWGIKTFSNYDTVELKIATDCIKDLFQELCEKIVKYRIAPDLTEEEVRAIELFLRPANRSDVSEEVAYRDYTAWRLLIEFGLRPGELLALRIQDCPRKGRNYISIVRINERIRACEELGQTYNDLRGKYAPQVKTLSRDLGFLFSDSKAKTSINDYITKYRTRVVATKEGKERRPVLDHDFLLISHDITNSGDPISYNTLKDLSETIKQETGIKFKPHLPRHVFFNRAYRSINNIKDPKAAAVFVEDLKYFGGWSSDKSLMIYTNAARRERARNALVFQWHGAMNTWDALND